jgi:hypothetical protein
LAQTDFKRLLDTVKLGPASDDEAIKRLDTLFQGALPEPYVEMLRIADGAEGWIGVNYLHIDNIAAVMERVNLYGQLLPGILFFASDGAEALFGFDLRHGSDRVLIVHTDDLHPSHLVELSPGLGEFLQLLKDRDWIEVWKERYKARD